MLSKTLVKDHQDYLRSQLTQLLAAGWQGYQQHGRGAVIIEDPEADSGEPWQQRKISTRYYSNQAAVSSNNGWPNKETRKLVREYNPQKQIVCLFLLPGGYCASYKTWSAEITPAQAVVQQPEN